MTMVYEYHIGKRGEGKRDPHIWTTVITAFLGNGHLVGTHHGLKKYNYKWNGLGTINVNLFLKVF